MIYLSYPVGFRGKVMTDAFEALQLTSLSLPGMDKLMKKWEKAPFQSENTG